MLTSVIEIAMTNFLQDSNQNIKVLELRNYLLKPNMADEFSNYFNNHFVKPMTELGGYTLGQFKINSVNDRFVWMRGFTDMSTRIKFLNDFYVDSPAWKEFGSGANDMMINSDNVYLLRPLSNNKNSKEQSEGINSNLLKTDKGVVIVDFYICNSTLDKVINLFNSDYIPFLKTLNIHNITLWVSEMSENDFPRLPVFQDKNLLLTITTYKDENEYQIKQGQINSMPAELKNSMQSLITIQNNLILCQINEAIDSLSALKTEQQKHHDKLSPYCLPLFTFRNFFNSLLTQIIRGIVTAMMKIRTIYFNRGFKKGLLPIKYPANTKLNIQTAEPVNVNKIKRRKFKPTIPATIDANVRMMGKYNPSVNASEPYFL